MSIRIPAPTVHGRFASKRGVACPKWPHGPGLLVILATMLLGASPAWPVFQPGFHLPGPSLPATAAVTFDDGGGPRLFVGVESAVDGEFGGVFTWDGTDWMAVGGPAGGLVGRVHDLRVFDDGGGPALWAFGAFTRAGGQAASFAAMWDGVDWAVNVDSSPDPIVGEAMQATLHDSGSGAEIYVGGRFILGNVSTPAVLRWTGGQWQQVGGGFNGSRIDAIESFDGGTGPELYVAGTFNRVESTSVSNVARWDGTSWSPLPGNPGTNGIAGGSGPLKLSIFDAGVSPKLYIAGSFSLAGGMSAEGLAAWDGAAWSIPDLGGLQNLQTATVHDFGDGEVMVLSQLAGEIFVWDGTRTTALDNSAFAGGSVATSLHSAGGTLLAGGTFFLADPSLSGEPPAFSTVEWTPTGWAAMTDGSPANGLRSTPTALQVFDDGTGPALYAGGFTSFASPHGINTLARWDGSAWHPVEDAAGQTLRGAIYTLATYHFNGVNQLIAAGNAIFLGDRFFQLIAWDGTDWTPILEDTDGVQGRVEAMEVYDDGSGPVLYIGGSFRDFGPAAKLARFDGTSFTSMPGPELTNSVYSLRSFNGKLWVGGDFFTAGFLTGLSGLATWDGSTWAAPPAQLIGPDFTVADVRSLEVHDAGDGQGEQLYVAGSFARSDVDDAPLFNIARLDEASGNFIGLGAGVRFPGTEEAIARDMLSFDPGDGPSLFVVGSFSDAGAVTSPQIARWQSNEWQAVGGPDGTGLGGDIGLFPALEAFQNSVYLVGEFSSAGGLASDRMAQFLLSPEVFADDFESGDLGAWSLSVPEP